LEEIGPFLGDQKSRKEAIDHVICKKLLKTNSNLEHDT
jgi:hypothetical protein